MEQVNNSKEKFLQKNSMLILICITGIIVILFMTKGALAANKKISETLKVIDSVKHNAQVQFNQKPNKELYSLIEFSSQSKNNLYSLKTSFKEYDVQIYEANLIFEKNCNKAWLYKVSGTLCPVK